MKLSDAFYEAACRQSGMWGYSCHMVAQASAGYIYRGGLFSPTDFPAVVKYSELMRPDRKTFLDFHDVEAAASSVNWRLSEFRTFMLLMASECMRVNGE